MSAPLLFDLRRAIEGLLVRYATVPDMRAATGLAHCFTEDVRADYGEAIGWFDGRGAFVAHLEAMLGSCRPNLHFITNIDLSRDWEEARSHCYTHAVVNLPVIEMPIPSACTYEDRLRLTEDDWQITDHVYSPLA